MVEARKSPLEAEPGVVKSWVAMGRRASWVEKWTMRILHMLFKWSWGSCCFVVCLVPVAERPAFLRVGLLVCRSTMHSWREEREKGQRTREGLDRLLKYLGTGGS
jgi:hypothetical protein